MLWWPQVKNPLRNIFSRRYRPELIMAIFIPFFQQLTGLRWLECLHVLCGLRWPICVLSWVQTVLMLLHGELQA